MIISHKHKFIYIRSCKTASTSIEVFLSAYCDKDDVITKMPEYTPAWHKAGNYGDIKNNHAPASQVKAFIGDEIFNDYFKFTSIRNPLDKMLSCYFWWRARPDLGPSVRPLDYSFSDWIAKYDFNHHQAIFHYPFYTIDGEIIADDYIRYESLIDDLQRICGILGLDYDYSYLLHYKRINREYVDITDKAIDKIRERFRQEAFDLGYSI